MTSAGFRSLLIADRQAHAAGATMVICELQGLTSELFEIGGFLSMFTVVASRQDAIRVAAAAVAK
jgi:anti-anti-sigma regulatory factor